MHRFEELDDVLSVLQKLAQREPALVAALPRQPGSREIRYTHLLSGEPDLTELAAGRETSASTLRPSDRERLDQLEAEVAGLRQGVTQLKKATLLALGGSLSAEDAQELRRRIEQIRSTWRSEPDNPES
jgi:uncharacterized protein YceH (UPF0502 family)